MPKLFVRKSSHGNWDGVSPETVEDISFPSDVLADLLDADNQISIWEIQDVETGDKKGEPDRTQLARLAAALERAKSPNLSEAVFRVISDFKLKELGLPAKVTPGNLSDGALNAKHRVVQVSSIGQVIKLAKGLKARPEVVLPRKEVMRAFATSLQEKWINLENANKDLLKRLVDEGFLELSATGQKK